jgi:hypothetical protein
MAIFIDGQKAGYNIHSRVVDGNTVRTTENMHLTMKRGNTPISVKTTETYIETTKGEPLGFETVMNMSFLVTKTYGKIADGKVHVKAVTGQLENSKTVDYPEGALMVEGLRLMEIDKGLVEGKQFSVTMFVPSLLKAVKVTAIVGKKKDVDLLGRVVKLTELKTKMLMPMAGEITTITYVDDEMNALKTVTPVMGMNLEMIVCSKEFALSENDPAEMLNKAFVKSPKPLGDLSKVKSIKYKIKPFEKAKFNIPVTDNQKVRQLRNVEGTMIVSVKPVKIEKEKIGYKGEDEEILKYLKPGRYVQSDNEIIKKLAKEAIGNTTDAAKAVKRIEEFVGDYINERSLSVGYASAVEVAQSRQGDCSEFAILTAALCRAAGIPARVAVGVAYVDEFEGFTNVFGGHAWTEAYVGGKWVGLDASFKGGGRGGYDAGHITLATGSGDPEDFIQMVFSIGQFEIVGLSIEK